MLWFIMALGMGGTAVAGFAFLNNTIERGMPEIKGILYLEAFEKLIPNMSGTYQIIYQYLKFHMIFFGLLHIAALVLITVLFFIWKNRYKENYIGLVNDPQRNFVIMAPVIAYGMCMNIFLVLGWVFIPWMRASLDLLLPLATGMYTLLWAWTIWWAVKIQVMTISNRFEVREMHFGWLLPPFALGMTSVTGTGISYLAHGGIADYIFFLSAIAFTFGLFLLVLKVLTLFRTHYVQGLPKKKELLPAFFTVLPIITILTISLLRFGYFFQHKYHATIPPYLFMVVVSVGFAFMTWYLFMGFVLLRNYLREHLFTSKNFDESQWGLICPMVAYAVLSTFLYKHGMPYTVVMIITVIFMALDVTVLLTLISRQYKKITQR